MDLFIDLPKADVGCLKSLHIESAHKQKMLPFLLQFPTEIYPRGWRFLPFPPNTYIGMDFPIWVISSLGRVLIQSVFSDYSRIGYLSNVLCFPVGCSPVECFWASAYKPAVVSPIFPGFLNRICGYTPFILQPDFLVFYLLPGSCKSYFPALQQFVVCYKPYFGFPCGFVICSIPTRSCWSSTPYSVDVNPNFVVIFI